MADRIAAQESDLLRSFREAYQEGNRAWNAGDFKRAYGGLPEKCEYDLAAAWPNARPLGGREEVVSFFQDLRETFPDLRTELGEFRELEEGSLLVGLHVTGTGGRSGAGVAMEIWQVWEMREGRPLRVSEFRDRRTAIEAAGVGAAG